LESEELGERLEGPVAAVAGRPCRRLPHDRRGVTETVQREIEPGRAEPAGGKHHLLADAGVAVHHVAADQRQIPGIDVGGQDLDRVRADGREGVGEHGNRHRQLEVPAVDRPVQIHLPRTDTDRCLSGDKGRAHHHDRQQSHQGSHHHAP